MSRPTNKHARPTAQSPIQFPSSRPDCPTSASELWAIQNTLMRHAESPFGTRNVQTTLCQPSFHSNGPQLRNTPTLDGAFAELSPHAAGYWPTVVYELAYETIHLLDPLAGITTWLEEGAAVEFSVLMSRPLTSHPMEPSAGTNYAAARDLVEHLPKPVLASIGHLRHTFGPLSSIIQDRILDAFPSVPPDIALKLTTPCKPR